jgi:uncharacterized protein YoxC|tara:strand:+ start:311 stop:613 length:303 start_codon:yes stop_codon:yes gene_type:complete
MPLEVYAEYGVMGVVVVLFCYMIMNLMRSQKLQNEDLDEIKESIKKMESVIDNMQGIVIKLIDRWNKSDDKAERRHEKFLDELNDLTDDVNFLKGRCEKG